MTAVFVSANARAAALIREFVRDGKAPVAELQNKLAEACGHAIQVRTKQVFQRYSRLGAIPASAGSSRTRWRFAFHSGPFALGLIVRMEIAPQDAGGPSNPYCKLDVATAAAPSVAVGTASVVYGSSDGSFDDVPWNFGGGLREVLTSGGSRFIVPDTEYVGTFYDYDYARLFAATVYEFSLEPDTDNGYPASGFAQGGPIFDEDRRAVLSASRLLWARSAVPLWSGGSESNVDARSLVADSTNGVLSQSIGDIGLAATGAVDVQGALSASIGTFALSAQGTAPMPDLEGDLNWSPTQVSTGGTSALTVQVAATGADQTSIALNVRIGDLGGLGISGLLSSAPTTTNLGGWTQSTSWSSASGLYWEANFTRASLTVAAGYVALEITATASPGSVEEYQCRMSLTSAEGGSFVLTGSPLAIAPSFEATIVTPTNGSTHNTSAGTVPLACTCRIVAQGTTQTDGIVKIEVRDNYDAHIQGVSTTDLDGWTQSVAWASTGGIWAAEFSKASVPPGTDEIDFEIDWLNSNDNHTTISTNNDGSPQTDQATGVGNDVTVDVNL